MPDITKEVTISITLPRSRAWAFAEVIKKLQRSDIGPAGLNLANPHQPDEQSEAQEAIDQLQHALRQAGFETR